MKEKTTYSDIVESKIAEWNDKIDMLLQHAEKVPFREQTQYNSKILRLRSAVETATLQLRDLDRRENIGNTVSTKDEILGIFESIDKDLTNTNSTTPFML